MPSLKQHISLEAQKHVTVLCTSEVWPSDCTTFLWSLYGTYARPGDLDNFRASTRNLLGEYTDHFVRQRITDPSREELNVHGSLANAVHCDRLDRVVEQPGCGEQMSLL